MKMLDAIVRIKPDKVELYERTFRDLQKLVHANEPGTPFYELCKDLEEPGVYHVFEAYADDEAREAHGATDYYIAAARVFLECLAGDHMEEAARRGLTEPHDIYPLAAESLKVLVYDTI